MRLSFSKPPVGGVEESPYDGETYMMLVARRNSKVLFSKPRGNAHTMHRRWIQFRVALQIQPYRTHDVRCVVFSRRLFGSGDRRKVQDVMRLAGDSPKNGRAWLVGKSRSEVTHDAAGGTLQWTAQSIDSLGPGQTAC